jgi:rhamnogalacturonyl hydrolase YesR
LTGKGIIKGKTATVELPDYIPHLIRTEDMNIQLTNNRHKHTLWVDEIHISTDPLKSYFTVAKKNNLFDNKTYEFFWSFSAIRKDIPHLQVED